MKKLIILATVAMFALCSSAMAVTITYGSGFGGGAKDEGGVLLEGSMNYSPYGGEYLGVNPLVELLKQVGTMDNPLVGGDDVLLNATTIGAGLYAVPFNGEWMKTVDVALVVGDPIYVRIYNGADTAGPSSTYVGTSAATPLTTVAGGQPSDYQYWFPGVQTNIPIPEPTIMLAGLALLLLKKKK